MNWEGFRTLLLTVLVLLSFVLTWNLWTNQIGHQTSEGSNFVISNIVNDGKKTITQVVQPDLAVYDDGEHYYGFHSGGRLNTLFQAISQAKYDFYYIRPQTNTNQKENLNQIVPNKNWVEFRFPTQMPLSLFSKILFGSSQGKLSIDKTLSNADTSILFNHIVISPTDQSKSKSKKLTAYFMNHSTVEAKARLSNASFSNLQAVFEHHKQQYIAKSSKAASHVFYLKAQPDPKIVSYRYTMINEDKFKNAFFPSSNVVHPYNDYYTSESLFLRASNNTIKFVNSAPGTGNSKTRGNQVQAPIETSFNFVNSHSGWTDHYILFNYVRSKDIKPDSQSKVIYRLLVGDSKGDYPVFNSGTMPFNIDAATLHITVQSGDISELSRSMMNLSIRIQTYPNPVKFKTGHEAWKELTSNKDINMKQVKDMRIGYEMKYPPSKSREIRFQPKWFVLYNGNWQTLDQLSGVGNQGKRGKTS